MAVPVKCGVIGCGNISSTYLRNLRNLHTIEVVACADQILERAQERAKEYGVPHACSVEELLADPSIELVLNLTIPKAHAAIALAALAAGKHVYNEKPLATQRPEAKEMLDLARSKGLRIGCAPDTFLGGGLQTCRKLIDEGAIGRPIAATAFFAGHGPEGWHPDPDFFFQPGAGPMLDMGPYYLTALVSMLGPVRRVGGATAISFPERTITSQPHRGEKIVVNTPTHLSGMLEFASGAIGAIITSFDVWATNLPKLEIYGSEGSLSMPDPNTFKGPVRIFRASEKVWKDVDLTHGFTEDTRGIGITEMAHAIRSGKPHRATGEMAYHILDIMQAVDDSSKAGRHMELNSACARPEPLPATSNDLNLDQLCELL